MPQFNLRYYLEKLGLERGEEGFVVQIGAMDGKTSDPVHEHIIRFRWAGLLAEPVAEQFARLRETYAGQPRLKLVNVAVAERAGTAVMHRVPADVAKRHNLPKWTAGASSLYADRNALAFESVRPFVVREEVACQPLMALLEEHQVKQIDVFQIDAEGHDYHILRQLDFARFHPQVINLEIVNLPKSEQTACKKLLDRHNYLYTKAGYDLLAVSLDWLAVQQPQAE